MLEKETKNRMKLAQKAHNVIGQMILPVIVEGDFNMPIESSIYQNHWSNRHNAFSETGNRT